LSYYHNYRGHKKRVVGKSKYLAIIRFHIQMFGHVD